jgi:acyl-ACP thioesterase
MCAMARAVWVYVNLDTGVPLALAPSFFEVYGEDVRKHKVSARLQHPAPTSDAKPRPWPLRVADFDIFGHVNNAIYWSAVEDELPGWLDGRRIGHCEMEFRAGVDPGDEPELLVDAGDGRVLTVWFMVRGEVRASARVHPQETP